MASHTDRVELGARIRRSGLTCRIAVLVAGSLVCAACSGGSTGTPSSGGTTIANATPSTTVLSALHLAPPPVPATLVAVEGSRIAVYNSATGAELRALTGASRSTSVTQPRTLTVATGREAWFIRGRNDRCGNSEIQAVPVAGGPTRTVVRGPAFGDIGRFSATKGGALIAYSVDKCPVQANQKASDIRVLANGQRHRRIELPRHVIVAELVIGSGRLAFITIDQHDQEALHSVALSTLHSGENPFTVTTLGASLGPRCRWDHLTWSDTLGLLATQTCQNADPQGWPTTLYALNSNTLRPTTRGLVIAHDLGINALAADPAGHLIVWLAGGDRSGAVLVRTSDDTNRLDTPICVSARVHQPACLREPAW